MQIPAIERTTPEKVFINVKNVDGAGSLTTGRGVCYAVGNEDVAASADGINAVLLSNSAELRPAFIGVAKADIAINAYGLVHCWGFVDSIALSFEADKTIGLLAGASLLRAAAAGMFTSALAPEAISTYMGKYLFVADTVNISGGLPYAKGYVRCL